MISPGGDYMAPLRINPAWETSELDDRTYKFTLQYKVFHSKINELGFTEPIKFFFYIIVVWLDELNKKDLTKQTWQGIEPKLLS